MIRCRRSDAWCLAAAWLAACSGGDGNDDDATIPYETLSAYELFEGPLADQRPRAGVVRYEVASQLWADGMGKDRYIVLPEGERATFQVGEDWGFPVGTFLVKVFWSALDRGEPEGPRRLLETRLLIREDAGWTAHVYVWNDAQTDAVRTIAGAQLDVETVDEAGAPLLLDYVVPNTNQCAQCHGREDAMHLLGVVGPQMARTIDVEGAPREQLEWLAEQDLFDAALPDLSVIDALVDPAADGPTTPRARAWLHANCSHCHRPGGGAGRSGLVLLAWEADPARYGVCKVPAAAGPGTGGHAHDIVPGDPDASIMPFRMASTAPGIKMPELPNRLPDPLGLELVRAWIGEMPDDDCL